MANDTFLKVENLSKQYRLGVLGTGTLSHDLNRWWNKMLGKEDPFLTIGETNDRSTKGESQYVWALKNINFDVKRGEVLGIIGKNGAGKSTLLKILSKVTSPTTGFVKSKGKIASLLEVGTGFHPEMTGKENIFLNGAILGMTKKEISSKLDEIVSFSGCERYIDTPVKRYSSGMKVRLAFAVAAFLEPDILVVDEVLAVGDAEFQKKAIGKMQDISNSDGRTVLFVSHDMGAINKLCSRCILLEHGEIATIGNTQQVISEYLKGRNDSLVTFPVEAFQDSLTINDVYLSDENNQRIDSVLFNQKIKIISEFTGQIDDFYIEYKIYDKQENLITTFSTYLSEKPVNLIDNKSVVSSECIVDSFSLLPEKYSVNFIVIKKSNLNSYKIFENAITFDVLTSKNFPLKNKMKPNVHGTIIFDHQWETVK